MTEEESEDIIAIAKYNYETFYSLPHGSVPEVMVVHSSAGIAGWSSCVLTEPANEARPQEDATCKKRSFDAEKEESSEAELNTTEESPLPAKKAKSAIQRRGDEEEAAQLRLALLQSVGVNATYEAPNDKSHGDFETDDVDAGEVCFEYDEGNCTESEWSDEDEDDSGKEITTGGDSEEDRISARTARLRIEEPEHGHERKDSGESFVLVQQEIYCPDDAEFVNLDVEEASQHSEGSFALVDDVIGRTGVTDPDSSD